MTRSLLFNPPTSFTLRLFFFYTLRLGYLVILDNRGIRSFDFFGLRLSEEVSIDESEDNEAIIPIQTLHPFTLLPSMLLSKEEYVHTLGKRGHDP